MSRILMLVQSGVFDDARLRREIEALVADGHHITAIGSQPPVGPHALLPADVRFVSETGSEKGRSGSVWARVGRWWLLPEYRVVRQRRFRSGAVERARGIDFDVVHCHDFPTLAAGLALAAGRPVVYDSHECWYGRLRHGRPEPLRRRRQLRSERRMAARCATVVTVSEELDRWVQRYLSPRQTVVVRNTFLPVQTPGRPPESPTGLVYAGRIAPGRDLDTAFAASLPPNLPLTLIGPRQSGFSIPERVRYDGTTDVDLIPAVLVQHGLALVSLEDTCLNHRLALPNKVFQAVASGVPVVAADLPALRRLVRKHGIGTLYQPGNPESLVRAVAEAVDRYPELKDRVREAQPALSWEVDAGRLRSVYRDFGP